METVQRVLFICIHNSARSQMAEAFLKELGKDRYLVESAGLKPTEINPLVVAAMKEVGHDLSGKKTNSVFDFFKEGRLYDTVITVCDESSEGQCPIFPGVTNRLHWPFPDPSQLTGTDAEKLEKVREIREQIRGKIAAWIIEEEKKAS